MTDPERTPAESDHGGTGDTTPSRPPDHGGTGDTTPTRPAVGTATRLTRWAGATAILVAIALLGVRYGHNVALAVMLVLLVAVAILGGSSRHTQGE